MVNHSSIMLADIPKLWSYLWHILEAVGRAELNLGEGLSDMALGQAGVFKGLMLFTVAMVLQVYSLAGKGDYLDNSVFNLNLRDWMLLWIAYPLYAGGS